MPNKIPLVFYRENGIRKLNQLLNPVVVNITDLPKGSIYHFVSEDADNPNIDPSDPILNYPSASRIALEYVTELKEFEGNPRRVNYQYQVKAREFTRVYKKFKINKDAVATNSNPRVLTLINYSYINNFYKYPPTKYAYISSWRNITSTIYSNIEEVCKRSSFDNYITIPVPESIPSRTLLNKASNNFNLSMVKIFKDTGTLTLLELWKWIDPSTRDKSIFSKISKDHLKKVNFIFKAVNGKTSIVNMAYMFSWIEGNDNLTPIKSLITKNPVYIQKALLYFLIVLNTTLNTETDTEEDIKDTEEVKDEYTKAFEETEDELNEDNEEPSPSLVPNTNTPSDKVDLEGEVDFDDDPKEISMADIDVMLDDLEKLEKKKLKALGLEVDGDEIVEVQKTEEDSIAIESMIFNRLDNKEALLKKLEDRIDNGNLTAAEYRKVIKDLEKYESMKDPYGTGKLLKDAKVVTTDDIKIDEVNSTIKVSYLVPQESMKKSSLLSFTEDYTNSVMKKDMLSMVDSLQRGGIVVRNYDVKEENTILGSYEIHSLDLKPVDGAASTIHFKIPKVDKDGTFSVNGSKYVYRTQRVDVPIRKIAPTKVALTSYYGKSFVSLDEKKAYSEIDYIVRSLESLAIEDTSKVITVKPADVFDPEFTAPFIYSMLSNYYSSIELDSCTLYFDHESRRSIPINKDITLIENNGSILIGVSKKGNPIMVDIQNNFYAIVGDEIKNLGTIYDLAGIDNLKAPVEYANVKVFSRDIPVGIYLSYFLGFSKLLKYLNVKYRVVAPRKQKDLANDEYAITFRDGSYIFSRKDRKASLILGGFTTVQNELKRYDAVDLDSQDVYLNLLMNKKITGIHLKEMENTQDYFIDHITLEVLKEMKEPTTFNGLLVRSCELLLTYYHPKTQDLNYMRFRGYERFSGFAYAALVDAIRSYKGRNISGKAEVVISPYEVWNRILKDESVKIVEDINPIQNLKEKEIVTFTGEGGRSKETITMEMRAYHISDIGNISEANIDSGDTGINTYMPPNPHLASLRGVIKRKTEKEKNASILTMGETSILSTSGLLSPMVYKDDGKRASFVGIQHSHTISTKGAHPPQFRTGYEYVIGSRTDPIFCYNSRQDGVVKDITSSGIFVQYKDGTTENFEIGTIYGKAEGSVYPHQVVTDLKVGQKFKEGDNIVYNKGFFERDILDPSAVIMKNSFTVKVALTETPQTHEDSCAISKAIGEKLRANTTKVKSIIVDFDQGIHDLVKVGQKVNAKDPLMLISDSISEGLGFNDESLAALKKLSSQSPRAGYLGTIGRIEVLYNGEIDNMSESLRAIVKKSNSELASRYKVKGMSGVTGRVTDEYSIAGKPLTSNKAEIKIYINLSTHAGVGD